MPEDPTPNAQSPAPAAEAGLGAGALIVTPTYNEADNLPLFVTAVREVAPAAHILVVDDNSPDGTGELAEDLSRTTPNLRVMHRPAKLGLGTAYVDAFTRGLGEGYDYFLEMDTDLSHDPRHLPLFFRAFAEGADVVAGSRNIPGGGVEGWGPGRHVLSKGGSFYSRHILGVHIRDLTTGYKGFTRHALEQIDLAAVRSSGYSFQIEMTYRALRKGLKVVEVPILFVDRRVGQSKMDRRIFAEAITAVWKLRLAALAGKL
ncbi:MAG: polyprenol monophosphomannose synthase [Myxococcales bacterium]|nr:polyprenol monophosphomannose synthase [Myxococcales bacterium]